MKALKIILIVIGVVVLLNITLTVINILQNGSHEYKGQSVADILGVPPENARLQDIQKLDKAQVMQLFYAAPAPVFDSMKGEYRAQLLPLGVLATGTDVYTHHFFGPGHWEGKGLYPFEKENGWGYNMFSANGEIIRARKFNTYIGPSTIDKKPAFHLDYSPYNTCIVHSMHDEVRKINDGLYICMGHMALGGGAINPAPFVLLGPPSPWVGIR